MKKTKNLVGVVCALSLAVGCMLVPAAAEAPNSQSDGQTSEFALIGSEITPRGPVYVWDFRAEEGEGYTVVDEFTGEYTYGTQITVSGTWSPTYVPIKVRLVDEDSGASVEATIDFEEPTTFMLWADSTWTLQVMTTGRTVEGSLRVSNN